MKSLNILDLGGMPFTQNRVKWLQDGIKEAIGNGLTFGGYSSLVISGARSTFIGGTTYGNTAGKVVINGEVCDIDADTVGIDVNALPHRYIEPVITFDASGNVTNFNTTTAQLYQIIKYKVVGYTSTQAGKVEWDTLPYFEDIINDMVFNKGANQSINAGLLELPSFENIFTVNISSSDTLNEIIKFDPSMTVLWLQFVGTDPTDYVTINNGSGINTPGGNSYIFKSGDWAMFIADPGIGIYQLVNNGDQVTPWVVPSFISSVVTFSVPVDDAVKFKSSMNGRIELKGQINTASYPGGIISLFILPAFARPSEDYYFYITGLSSGALIPIIIHVGTNGLVTISTTAGQLSFSLTGLYLSTL